MSYEEIIEQVSKETCIPKETVDKIYKSFWTFIRETVQELPLKDDLTEEEFNKLKTSFNIPSLGKLYCTYEKYLGMKSRLNYIKNIKEKNEKINKDKTNV